MRGMRAVLCTLLICGTYLGSLHYQANIEEDMHITVEGIGSTQQTPDRADIVLNVTETGATSIEAKNLLTQQMKKLEALFSGENIPEKQIKSEEISLQQEWSYVSGARVADGFVARQRVAVILTGADVEKKAEVLLGKLPNKVEVESSHFSLVEKKLGLEDARAAAFEDAKKQAQQLAQLAGKQLGKVISISLDDQSVNVYPTRAKSANFMMAEAVTTSDVSLYAGEQEQTARLSVTFELK